MKTLSVDGPRLARISDFCAALPETTRAIHADYAEFRVRKKIFAYYLHNHNSDGIISVCCRSELGENVDRAGREPDLYYLPRYIGKRGWFGIRLDRRSTRWDEIENAIELSYCLAAPKKLAAIVKQRYGTTE